MADLYAFVFNDISSHALGDIGREKNLARIGRSLDRSNDIIHSRPLSSRAQCTLSTCNYKTLLSHEILTRLRLLPFHLTLAIRSTANSGQHSLKSFLISSHPSARSTITDNYFTAIKMKTPLLLAAAAALAFYQPVLADLSG